MPTTVETTMETPGTEGMTTTAGTQQQQKQHINNSLKPATARTPSIEGASRWNHHENKRDISKNRQGFNSRHTRNITDKQYQQRHQQYQGY
jgi:hypothetical protein